MHILVKPLCLAALLLSAALPAAAQNLIPNPGFEKGNTGFTSDYNFMDQNSPQYDGQITAAGNYAIGNNANIYDQGWPSTITPHSGFNMMIVDGAGDPNMQIWTSPPITVKPHRNYDFSVFGAALFWQNPAELEFRINGQQIGPVYSPGQPAGQWTQFKYVWNSGASTAAVISVSDDTTDPNGNDFVLDDFYFAKQPWLLPAHVWAANAVGTVSGWINAGAIFSFGLSIFGFGLAILGIGLAILGVQVARLLSDSD